MTTLGHDEIASLARDLAASQQRLRDAVEPLREEQRRLVRRRLRGIRSRVAQVAAAREALHQAVQEHPHLFERPRTRAQEGVKYGLRKRPGRIVGDKPAMVAAIRKRMPDRAAAMIKVTAAPVLAALRRLSAAELASIGASIVDTGDEVVIRVVADDDIEQLVSAMLDDAGTATEPEPRPHNPRQAAWDTRSAGP